MYLRLTDLEARFVRWEQRLGAGRYQQPDGTVKEEVRLQTYHVTVDTIEEAQGVQFLCPTCFVKNSGPIGTHQVLCWSRSRGIPDDALPGPGRWLMQGTGLADLTLQGDAAGNGQPTGARSVDLGAGEWHGHITGGIVT